MPQSQAPVLSDIFTAYISLRQGGSSMDEAVEQLTPQADLLPRSERHQLGKLVTTWEANNGAHHKPHRKPAPEPVTQVEVKAEPPKQASGPTPFGTRFLDPSKLPQPPGQSVIRPIEPLPAVATEFQLCPNCNKKNKPGEMYCFSCGHILKAPAGITQPFQELDARARFGTAHFGERSTLYLAIRGAPNPFKIALRDELIIGRSTSQSALGPDIDLSSFGAEKLGVSRLHAALKRTGDTISLMDLQSSNRTFVNGQRMYAHEVRVLRDGDEIRLGKLVIKVIFRH